MSQRGRDTKEPLSAAQCEIARLQREVERLKRRRDCRACDGIGIIEGFWLGTVKKCPACNGRGVHA